MKKKLNTVFFVSLGCPKNKVDTEVMAGKLLEIGLSIVGEPEQAHIIIINTCSFISDAKEESIDAILEMIQYKETGQCERLLVTGCLSQRNGEELSKEIPEIDGIIGTSTIDELEKIIFSAEKEFSVGMAGHYLQTANTPRFIEESTPSAYIKIADGCSRKCAFCAIPAIRGKAKSRSVKNVVAEVKGLVAQGVKEVNLVSQDTAAYGDDLGPDDNLINLLGKLNRIKDLHWIRIHYLYPDGVTDELLTAMRELPKVVPYLDVPIQHASKNVLKRMRRGHGPKVLAQMVTRIKEKLPNAFLRTTVLVGHPGETAEDFDALLDFIKWAEFDHLGAFRYSDEESTPAYQSKGQVSRRDSYNRFRKVMAVQRKIALKKKKALLGNTLQMLVEESADDQGFVLQGRHQGQAPEIDGVTYLTSSNARRGDIVTAKVIDVNEHDVVCEPVDL